MKNIIGFANVFYTLWTVEEFQVHKTDNNGNAHLSAIEYKYTYIKNISTDLEKVKLEFPNTELDLDLRGNVGFSRFEQIELPINIFWSGKYDGFLIDTVIDIDFDYCLWCVKNSHYKVRDYIKSLPKYLAYLQGIELNKQEKINNMPKLNIGDVIQLDFISNGFNSDEISNVCFADATFNGFDVRVKSNGFKYVDGRYPYEMIMINGKAKRTKNKTVLVTIADVKIDFFLFDENKERPVYFITIQ